MMLSAIIMESSPQSVHIFFQAISHPSASRDVTESRVTNNNVGISKGKPRTGSRDEFFPVFAAIADTSVSEDAIPMHPNWITQKNIQLS